MTQGDVTVDQATMRSLVARFGGEDTAGLMLMGSRAQGSAGPHSDVDLVRLSHDDGDRPQGDGTYLISRWLVVVSSLTPARVERIFVEPETACESIIGLRTAQILADPQGRVQALLQRAHDFVWDTAMQARANAWAAEQLVGWVEEAHKGLEGLRRDDVGRLLNARFGLSWGLSRVVMVQRGVLLSSDNGIWDEVNRAVGETSTWVKLRRRAFGLGEGAEAPPSLPEQVVAGLRLYVATVALCGQRLPEPDRTLINATTQRIERELEVLGL